MAIDQADKPKDLASYGEEMYQRGRYDVYLEMGVLLAQELAQVPHPQSQPDQPQKAPAQDAPLSDWPIESLGLNNLAIRVLRREGVTTIRHLTKFSIDDLKGFRGMGVCTALDVRMRLRDNGLTLREI